MERFFGLEFTDHQKYILLSSWIPSNVVWMMSRNSGKMTTLDTRVYGVFDDHIPMAERYKKKTIGDLKVGDSIYDERGNMVEIIHLNPIVLEPVYEVEFDDGEIIECGQEHLWPVYDRIFNRRRHKDFIIERNTDFIYNNILVNNKIDEKHHDYRFHVPINQPIKFPKNQNLPIDPYLFGLWIGDGTSNAPDLTCHKDDVDEIISYIKNNTKTILKEEEIDSSTGKFKGCYKVHIDRKREIDKCFEKVPNKKSMYLSTKLNNLNVFKNKDIPEMYLYSSIEQRLSLLQGLMDTDGTIDKNGHCEFTQTKKNLVDEICWLLNSLGIKYTLTHKTKTGYIKKDGTEADTWRIYFTSSKKMPCFRLKRKYNRLSDLPLRGSDRKAIVDIRKTEKIKSMRCITVNNESGCFLCGEHCTVTHNSYLSSPLMMARAILIPNTNTYIMAPAGGQAQETFGKMESLAKNQIASVLGVTSVFLEETVRQNAAADPFVHDKNSYHVELYNGSTINTLNSVVKNIVGIR